MAGPIQSLDQPWRDEIDKHRHPISGVVDVGKSPQARCRAEGGAAWLWAKTERDGSWHSLASHMIDSLYIAFELWDGWLSASTKRWLAEPLGENATRALFAWLAGCHDIGKASPAFQAKDRAAAERANDAGFAIPLDLPPRPGTAHGVFSAAAVSRHLEARYGWTKAAAPAAIVGGHHGWFPPHDFAQLPGRRPAYYGNSDPWEDARSALFALVTELAGEDLPLETREPDGTGGFDLGRPRELALSGYVVLADWLASNEDLFPRSSMPFTSRYIAESAVRAKAALDCIGWRRWSSQVEDFDFQERFLVPPRPLQREAISLAKEMGSGLLLVEAPTGIGKTEAAMAVVEVLSGLGFGGVYLALPTQASANQTFARVLRWIQKMGGDETLVELAHGKARGVEAYKKLTGRLAGVGIDDDEGEDSLAVAEEWFHGPKRRLLAPFVVGTIDQVLLSAAMARHVAIRQAGLVGKVVVIDEVHACDAHMSVFLHRALAWFGKAGVPVVLLSATLPSQARRELVSAYAGQGVDLPTISYPSVTHVGPSGLVTSRPVGVGTTSRVAVDIHEEPGEEIAPEVVTLIGELADRGANVLVVRNTVKRAQDTYELLEGNGVKAMLTHSRFVDAERRAMHRWLEERFGPEADRPRGHVVVGTQVLEQSLDVDFDVLVTDMAPMDLLIQRVGRVHRYESIIRPSGFEVPRMVVVGMGRLSPEAAPTFPGGSVYVYSEHLLLRSASTLLGVHYIDRPGDVARLVEMAYGDGCPVPPAWQGRSVEAQQEWEKKRTGQRAEAARLALADLSVRGDILGLCKLGLEGGEEQVEAGVRGGRLALEVVVGRLSSDERSLECVTGATVPLDHEPTELEIDGALGSCLRLSPRLSREAESLEMPSKWKKNPWLKRLRILPLDAAGRARLGGRVVEYSSALGLCESRPTHESVTPS